MDERELKIQLALGATVSDLIRLGLKPREIQKRFGTQGVGTHESERTRALNQYPCYPEICSLVAADLCGRLQIPVPRVRWKLRRLKRRLGFYHNGVILMHCLQYGTFVHELAHHITRHRGYLQSTHDVHFKAAQEWAAVQARPVIESALKEGAGRTEE